MVNKDDKKHIELVDYKIDELKQDIIDLKVSMDKAHIKTDENLRFIKENLFNPNEGLWAETKKNSEFRESTNKWRGIIGSGFIALFVKQIYDMFTRS
tara:strand:+ start:71 stop:361 length:291 start_codon:yes stop_codon:yes gene_type:complete